MALLWFSPAHTAGFFSSVEMGCLGGTHRRIAARSKLAPTLDFAAHKKPVGASLLAMLLLF
ncbi:hypothetical protein A0U95_24315 [Pseudomonas brassicacearum]|nr:hypothetical protein A0U95_24315 [Pseudomonas brassicacearum]